jgi:hypothetical protein
LTAALAAVREHKGLSQLEVDALAGFPDGYTGKIEKPSAPALPGSRKSGRWAFPATLDLWLAGLELELIVVPRGAQPEPGVATRPNVAAPPMTLKRAQKIRALRKAGRSRETLWRMFQITPQMVDDILAGRAFVPPTI